LVAESISHARDREAEDYVLAEERNAIRQRYSSEIICNREDSLSFSTLATYQVEASAIWSLLNERADGRATSRALRYAFNDRLQKI